MRKVLTCITNQSYKNIEIIISINPTPNPEINYENISICVEYWNHDKRIDWTCQIGNIGAENNFRFVRSKAKGKYFMTAQDDDWWSNRYIEKLVEALEKNPDVPLACCPSAYISKGVKQKVMYLNKLSVFNAVGNGDIGLATQGIWRRDCWFELEFPRNQVLGVEHVVGAIILLKYENIISVDSERYVKGYTEGKFGDCFKNEPFYAFNSWWFMMKTLATTDKLSREKKVLIPMIAVTNFVRAIGITGIQAIVSMPNNPVKRMVQGYFFGAN